VPTIGILYAAWVCGVLHYGVNRAETLNYTLSRLRRLRKRFFEPFGRVSLERRHEMRVQIESYGYARVAKHFLDNFRMVSLSQPK